MPPLEGMDSADEAPPQPPMGNQGRRGNHPPVAQTRRNAAPPSKAQPQSTQVARKDSAGANGGGDFFGFGSSLTVKGMYIW